ncbi:hypothetical protein RJ639_041308 [Escallonia herrerae]|uniref:Uncharacterized protein n=1 Tax=Escallonia herrerae TaxID=1293975 RepID=A0AA89B4V6_9ASTE|nr:hypothetical protein RJ639_041308 [Escallonia herrerae]
MSAVATHLHPHISFPFPPPFTTNYPTIRSPWRPNNGIRLHASISLQGQRQASDPELRSVLELATASDYFSPLLKSLTKPADIDYVMIQEDPYERDDFLTILESRFFFLAADARSTLRPGFELVSFGNCGRGWRPSYRNVLLSVRKELKVPCSTKLPTADLEVEIFLHLLQDYSSEASGSSPRAWESSEASDSQGSLELGLSQWKVQAGAALKFGTVKLRSLILKGGGMLTLGKIYEMLARGLSGRMLLDAANYQMKNEIIRKGGHLAAINLESRAALLAAKKGVAGAASRYLGLRSVMALFGPMLWGTFLADIVIQMLGTDYARILRAIYAFAQVRCLVCMSLHIYGG